MSALSHMGVVVPVHQEEELLAQCLEAIMDAASVAPVPVTVVVVLDACTDRSADIAGRFPVATVTIDEGCVGAARRAGADHLLEALGHRHARRIWIANTDADSRVPVDWLAHHATLAHEGADVVLGGVRPDLAALAPAHADLWRRTHPPGRPTGNVHGANLGIRAGTYLAAGGFALLPEHEDVDLVARAIAVGATVTPTDGATVATSARFIGRTPGGYAGYLRALDAELRHLA